MPRRATPQVPKAKGWGAGLGSPAVLVRTPQLLAESRGSQGATDKKARPLFWLAWSICPIFSDSCLDSILLLIRLLS